MPHERFRRVERDQVGEREHLAELRQGAAGSLHLCALLVVLAEDADCTRVLEHVRDVMLRRGGVDRRGDRPDVCEREVGQGPVERRAGQDRVGVALAQAAREKAVGPRLDRRRGFAQVTLRQSRSSRVR